MSMNDELESDLSGSDTAENSPRTGDDLLYPVQPGDLALVLEAFREQLKGEDVRTKLIAAKGMIDVITSNRATEEFRDRQARLDAGKPLLTIGSGGDFSAKLAGVLGDAVKFAAEIEQRGATQALADGRESGGAGRLVEDRAVDHVGESETA